LKKIQQFHIFKFDSKRLKDSNYSINITIKDAKETKEIISISNSELIRALFRLKGVEYDQNEVDKLIISIKKLKNQKNTINNRKKIEEEYKKLEKILFIEDLVTIKFSNKSHYREILKRNGFYVNGIKFTPFMASAGMIRRNTAMFINNNIKHPLMDILENGRDESVPLVPAKWGAYFSLYSSTSLPVSFPNFAVIPDKEIETIEKVDFVTYQGEGLDDIVEEREMSIKANAFDGQGIISPRLAEQWSKELELDYVFSSAVIRAPFIKGLINVFDLNKFATKVAKKYTFIDIYGKERDIRNVDLIISESMFKLYTAYKDTESFIENCHKNKLGFSITKVNPKKENTSTRTSYQFLQVLNLTDTDIAELCEPTISWFRDISGNNPDSMILYALGETNFTPGDYKKLDPTVKAIMINPKLSNDKYIQKKFRGTLFKKRREAFKGSLYVNSNYQFMIADPYYQACHLFGIDCPPLLNRGEHYSNYWLSKGVKQVAAIRSPIVHHSEVNILNFKDTEETSEWYSHIKSGIIFPANGIGMDCAIHGGSDFDGDIICTINNPIIIKGKVNGNPIMYESQKAEKKIVDSRNDAEQVEAQLNGYNSKVGYATNVSSSLYALKEEFPLGTKEREVIENRLKIGRVIQGEIIDSVKGLKVPPFREHWVKPTKITDDMSEEERERAEFNNRIVCMVRPAFFKYLYPSYMGKYRKESESKSIYGIITSGSIIHSQNNEEKISPTKTKTFFIDNSSVMNKISRYMIANLSFVNKYANKEAKEYDYSILIDKEIPINEETKIMLNEYIDKFRYFKEKIREGVEDSETIYFTLQTYCQYLENECLSKISSNESELANYAVMLTYGGRKGMIEFPWAVFPDGIINNIIKNSDGKITGFVADENGEIEYLWKRYTRREFNLEDIYEN